MTTTHEMRVKSADRVFDVLELLVQHRSGLTLSAIAVQLAIPKSSASELLACMVARRYAVLDADTRRFRLGLKTWEVGTAFLRDLSLTDVAYPVMATLVAEVGETCHLAMLDGADVIYIGKTDPQVIGIRLASSIGARLPAHLTAVGKAQLAHLSATVVTDILAGAPSRPVEAAERDAVLHAILCDLAEVRQRGYAVDDGAVSPGIMCVAAPILDDARRPVAALGFSFIAAPVTNQRLETFARLLVAAAADIGVRCGYGVATPGMPIREAMALS